MYYIIIIYIYTHTHRRVHANLANREVVDEANELKKKVKHPQEKLEEEQAEEVRHCIQS